MFRRCLFPSHDTENDELRLRLRLANERAFEAKVDAERMRIHVAAVMLRNERDRNSERMFGHGIFGERALRSNASSMQSVVPSCLSDMPSVEYRLRLSVDKHRTPVRPEPYACHDSVDMDSS